jgi:hypothetical protein
MALHGTDEDGDSPALFASAQPTVSDGEVAPVKKVRVKLLAPRSLSWFSTPLAPGHEVSRSGVMVTVEHAETIRDEAAKVGITVAIEDEEEVSA